MYIEKFERYLHMLKKDMAENTHHYQYCGNAFIILNKQSDVKRLVDDFNIPTITRVYAYIVSKILKCDRFRYIKNQWEGKNINIERAKEPTDYYWENMAMKTKVRVIRSLITFFLNFISLGIALAVYSTVYKTVLGVLSPIVNKRIKAQQEIITRIALTFNSFLVMVINGLLCRIRRFLSYLETMKPSPNISPQKLLNLPSSCLSIRE
jgi:hypothetical protein